MDQQELEKNLRECNAKVASLQQQLNETSKEMEGLTYSISHDLRAPLRAIKGFSEALLEDYQDKLDADAQRYLNIVIGSTNQITRLMDAVLTLSRLGRQTLRPSTIDMDALIQNVVGEVQKAMGDRKIEFSITPVPAAYGDTSLIRHVWLNLIANAAKFTAPKALARIEIGSETQNGEACYFVKDNGVGFDFKHAEKLFGLFQRFHTEKEFEGVGAGLAVVQRLIRRHKGRIWAEARVNEGASFYFTLPPQG